jgi:DNA-binding MarR family transcriptional regulator
MRVTDPRAMRALAHPRRLDLIEALTMLGPATAAACARHLGSTQASCSFHLRQLAKYGFVEQAPESGDRRERPWRLTDLEQSWSADGGNEAAAAHLGRVFLQREADRMVGWVDAATTEPAEWRRAAFSGGALLPVTVDELTEIGERLRDVLEPYARRLADRSATPPGARFVRILLAATPQAHPDPEGDQT